MHIFRAWIVICFLPQNVELCLIWFPVYVQISATKNKLTQDREIWLPPSLLVLNAFPEQARSITKQETSNTWKKNFFSNEIFTAFAKCTKDCPIRVQVPSFFIFTTWYLEGIVPINNLKSTGKWDTVGDSASINQLGQFLKTPQECYDFRKEPPLFFLSVPTLQGGEVLVYLQKYYFSRMVIYAYVYFFYIKSSLHHKKYNCVCMAALCLI